MTCQTRRGITIVEILAVAVAMVILIASTAATVAQSRDDADLTKSFSNLRNLAVATQTYAADWNDRQCTLVRDNLAAYGDNIHDALAAYNAKVGVHPPILLGWQDDGEMGMITMEDSTNDAMLQPVDFDDNPFGWFRLVNAKSFNHYLGGRFYDPVFYAPKDRVAFDAAKALFEVAGEYSPTPDSEIYWSSYCWSPAALYHPDVLASSSRGGFKDPFSIAAGFRAPTFSQCRYPNLKTHFLEHHWLQNRPQWASRCNSAIENGTYGGCEPYYFNHYAYSTPAAAFYDGSVRTVLTKDVLDDDHRVRKQTQSEHGLWFRRPGGAVDGYYEGMSRDPTRTSYHIFTLDGILGRDVLGRQ